MQEILTTFAVALAANVAAWIVCRTLRCAWKRRKRRWAKQNKEDRQERQ